MNTYAGTAKRTLTSKQKVLWGIGITAVLLYFNPGVIGFVVRPFVHASPAKPSPAIAVTAPSAAEIAASEAAADLAEQSATFSGKWLGRGLVVGRGTCNVSLEIKTQTDAKKPFVGYSNMLCVDMTIHAGTTPEMAAILTAQKLAPESTALSGAVTKGTLGYTTDRVVSHGQSKCDLQHMDVTPFGSNQVAVQWKDSCGEGEMQLAKGNF